MTRASEIDGMMEAAAALPGFASSLGLPVPSGLTLATLGRMLAALPDDASLPRLATDTEGCVLMWWAEGGRSSIAVTVEGADVTATLNPGPASTHLDPFRWDEAWPDGILGAIRPARHGNSP